MAQPSSVVRGLFCTGRRCGAASVVMPALAAQAVEVSGPDPHSPQPRPMGLAHGPMNCSTPNGLSDELNEPK